MNWLPPLFRWLRQGRSSYSWGLVLALSRAYKLSSRLIAIVLPGCAAVLGIEDGTTQGACASADECAPAHACLLGVCRVACQTDADCGANATCLDLGGRSACLPEDATCGGAGECPDGTACEAERCRNLCETTPDCPGGQECDRGFCFSSEVGMGGNGGSGGGKGGSGGVVAAEGGMSGDSGTGGSSGGSAGKSGTGGSAGTSSEPYCGDGRRDTGERCDDGNGDAMDGCTDCEPEEGYSCSGDVLSACTPVCGDGLVVGPEALAGGCDDGGSDGGDGCNTMCEVEDGFSCTGMPSVCTEGCGNAVVDLGEGCDDGNQEPGDGCTACAVEMGFTCDDDGGASVCMSIDECTNGDASCDPNADCVDEEGGYRCECRTGWTGPGEICVDVNECGNGTCSSVASCMNTDGSFRCECPPTHAGNGIVCEDATLPDWPVPTAPDYTINGEVVRDNVTGLDWQITTDGPYTRNTAMTHCQNLELGGFTDWRLPSRIELSTLFFPRSNGGTRYLDETTFPNTQARYWTASPSAAEEDTGWIFSFSNTSSDTEPYSEPYYARCVRSTPDGLAAQRFTLLSSTLAQDSETGLVWARPEGPRQPYINAESACADLVDGEYSDFRLPTAAELLTVVNEDSAGLAVFDDVFDFAVAEYLSYWTTTSVDDDRAAVVAFESGQLEPASRSSANVYRRCVHDG
jgi:cysteine-rich repeat protein